MDGKKQSPSQRVQAGRVDLNTTRTQNQVPGRRVDGTAGAYGDDKDRTIADGRGVVDQNASDEVVTDTDAYYGEDHQGNERTLDQRRQDFHQFSAYVSQLEESNASQAQQMKTVVRELAEAKETIASREKRIKHQDDLIRTMGQEIAMVKEEITELEAKLKTRTEYTDTMEKKIAESTSQNMGLQRHIEDMKRRYKEEMERVESEFQQQNATISMFHKENHSLQKKLKKQEKEYEDQARELQSLRSDYGDLKSRCGKMSEDKMKHDLGDQNRSTKIGEKYGALYNEAWTDAWMNQTEELQYADEVATRNLLDILKNCYDFCKEKADDHFDQLTVVLTNPVQSIKECPKPTNLKIPATTSTTLREVRKDIAVGAADQIKAAYLAVCEKENDEKFIAATKPFIEQCVELCWVMVLNLPPLYMKFEIKPGTDIDTNLYAKRSSGDKIKELVWPPLFNGEGGGLLQKGVVEAAKKVVKKRK